MRQAAKRGLLTAMATGSVLASTAGYSYASADAHGNAEGSPGVLSGNTIQVPVDIPVNVCGNTVNVIGLLNPVMGSHCVNKTSGPGHAGGGSTASGGAQGSPGVGSGNTIQVPIHVPVNVCGNSVNVVGLGNITGGSECVNETISDPGPAPGEDHPPTVPPGNGDHGTPPKGRGHHPGHTTPVHTPPSHGGDPAGHGGISTAGHHSEQSLAHTGADDAALLAPIGAALLIGGAVLYRRSRVGSH
jgi:LPXTG-motif cell wall-anchored protein